MMAVTRQLREARAHRTRYAQRQEVGHAVVLLDRLDVVVAEVPVRPSAKHRIVRVTDSTTDSALLDPAHTSKHEAPAPWTYK